MMMVTAETWTQGNAAIEIRGYWVKETDTSLVCVTHLVAGEGDEKIVAPAPGSLPSKFAGLNESGRAAICATGMVSAAQSVHWAVTQTQGLIAASRGHGKDRPT